MCFYSIPFFLFICVVFKLNLLTICFVFSYERNIYVYFQELVYNFFSDLTLNDNYLLYENNHSDIPCSPTSSTVTSKKKSIMNYYEGEANEGKFWCRKKIILIIFHINIIYVLGVDNIKKPKVHKKHKKKKLKDIYIDHDDIVFSQHQHGELNIELLLIL